VAAVEEDLMGINYFWHRDVCPHCDRPAEIRHIGKKSGGWQFAFRGYYEPFLLMSWQDVLASSGQSAALCQPICR